MQKDTIERICRDAGMQPESRERLSGDYELFLADGFSLPPHQHYRRFGIEADEFEHGMYVTLWWLSRGSEKLEVGQPMFFDVMHDIESLPISARKRGRLNAARQAARDYIRLRKKNAH